MTPNTLLIFGFLFQIVGTSLLILSAYNIGKYHGSEEAVKALTPVKHDDV